MLLLMMYLVHDFWNIEKVRPRAGCAHIARSKVSCTAP